VAEVRVVRRPYGEAAQLVDELQQEYVQRYGGPDETPVEPEEFAAPHGGFLIAYAGDEPVGCGGYRRLSDGVVEIKRMYVRPAWRGQGIARLLLGELERVIAAEGGTQIRLMTGLQQPEALRLYETSGYQPEEAYGIYQCAPDARFFGKWLRRGPALCLMFVLVLVGCTGGTSSAITNRTLGYLADVVRGQCAPVAAAYDPLMRSKLTAARTCAGWSAYGQVFGSYVSHGQPTATSWGLFTVVRVPLRMSAGPGEFRVTFDPSGQIAGLYFLRPGVPL
jgi:GNAT superfamily N-acetyltransferase